MKMVVFGLYVVLATTVMALDVIAFFMSFTFTDGIRLRTNLAKPGNNS